MVLELYGSICDLPVLIPIINEVLVSFLGGWIPQFVFSLQSFVSGMKVVQLVTALLDEEDGGTPSWMDINPTGPLWPPLVS